MGFFSNPNKIKKTPCFFSLFSVDLGDHGRVRCNIFRASVNSRNSSSSSNAQKTSPRDPREKREKESEHCTYIHKITYSWWRHRRRDRARERVGGLNTIRVFQWVLVVIVVVSIMSWHCAYWKSLFQTAPPPPLPPPPLSLLRTLH